MNRFSKSHSSCGVPVAKNFPNLWNRTSLSSSDSALLSADDVDVEMTATAGGISLPMPSTAACRAAASLVDDALNVRRPNLNLARRAGIGSTKKPSVISFKFISSFIPRIYWIQFICLIYCILAFFEYVPGTNSNDFMWQVGLVEGIILFFLCSDIAYTYSKLGPDVFSEKRWEQVFSCIVAASVLDWLIFYCGGTVTRSMWRFSRPLRPFLALSQLPQQRRLIVAIFKTIPYVANISGFLLILVLFFGLLGLQLFNREQVTGYDPFNDNFEDAAASILSMFVLSTTENFPSVMYPSITARPFIGIPVFLAGVVILLWLIFPLVQAIVFEEFKDVKKILNAETLAKCHASLIIAYQTLMGGDGDAQLSKAAFAKFIPYIRRGCTRHTSDLLFAALDLDGSGIISIAEFLRIPIVMELEVSDLETELKHHKDNAAVNDNDDDDHDDKDSGSGVTSDINSPRAVSNSSYFQKIIDSPWLDRFSWFCIVGSISCAFVWSTGLQEDMANCRCTSMSVLTDDDSNDAFIAPTSGCIPNNNGCLLRHPLIISEAIALLFQIGALLEVYIRASVFKGEDKKGISGWLKADVWNMIDASLVLYGIIGSFALLFGAHEYLPLWASDIFEISRAGRALRVITRLSSMRFLVNTLLQVLPELGGVAFVYMSITYSYAIIGQALMYQYVPLNSPPLFSKAGICQKCQSYRFDTLPFAFLELLSLSVGNNWNSILYPAMYSAPPGPWIALYFCIYRFVMTDIMFAIIISLMIDGWAVSSKAKNRREMSDAIAASLLKRALGKAVSSSQAQKLQNYKKKKNRTWQGFVASIGSLSELSLVEDSYKKLKEEQEGGGGGVGGVLQTSSASSSALSPAAGGAGGGGAATVSEPDTAPTLEVYGITKEHLELVEKRLREYEVAFSDVEAEQDDDDKQGDPNESWSLLRSIGYRK